MTSRDLAKDIMYEGVKTLIENEASHIHLPQPKLYTLYSLAFNYFLYNSEKSPGHYIIRVEDSYLLEKLIRKAKDMTSRKFLQKMSLPRKLRYKNSTFHLDFFNFSTWSNTNDIPKDRIKGALIVKNTSKSPLSHDFVEDDTYQETIKALPENYFLESLKEFVPKIITIAYDENFPDLEIQKFSFIPDESADQILKGVSISSDVKIDDI